MIAEVGVWRNLMDPDPALAAQNTAFAHSQHAHGDAVPIVQLTGAVRNVVFIRSRQILLIVILRLSGKIAGHVADLKFGKQQYLHRQGRRFFRHGEAACRDQDNSQDDHQQFFHFSDPLLKSRFSIADTLRSDGLPAPFASYHIPGDKKSPAGPVFQAPRVLARVRGCPP